MVNCLRLMESAA